MTFNLSLSLSLSLNLNLGLRSSVNLRLSLGSSSHWSMSFFVSGKHAGMYGTLGRVTLRKLVITRVAVIKMLPKITCTQRRSILLDVVFISRRKIEYLEKDMRIHVQITN